MFGSGVRRPIPARQGCARRPRALCAWVFDQLGLDSDYDYDPLWQKCRELGDRADLPHRRPRPMASATARRNFTFNHIGHFAAAGHDVAKALFLGGVTRRFPDLRFALPRRRRRLGLPAVLRSDRALGAARRQGPREHGPDQARPPAAARAGRQIRLRGHRRRARQARRLAAEGRGFPDRRRCRPTTTSTATSPRSRTGSTSSRRRITSAARPTTG